MFTKHVLSYTVLILLSLIVLTLESPLDVRIIATEDERIERIELHFSPIPTPPHNIPSYMSRQQLFIPHRGNIQPPSHSQSSAVHTGYPRYDGPRVPFLPPRINIQPPPIPADYGIIPDAEKERPTNESTPLHLDFRITAPWVSHLPPPKLPKTVLPQPSDTMFTTIRCTNTSFAEDVFCDLRSLIPEQVHETAITKVYYVLLRFPHPYLNGTKCTALLQPRDANNYDDEDETKDQSEEVGDGKETIEIDEKGKTEGKNETIDTKEEGKIDVKMSDPEEGSGQMMDVIGDDEDMGGKDDAGKSDEDERIIFFLFAFIYADEGEKEKNEGKVRKKRDHVQLARENEDPLHIFYDRSTCKPMDSKTLTSLIRMEDVTHIEISFFGNTLTHLAKLIRNTQGIAVDPSGGTDNFPLFFTVDMYNYVSPVAEGSEETECRSDGKRCRP